MSLNLAKVSLKLTGIKKKEKDIGLIDKGDFQANAIFNGV